MLLSKRRGRVMYHKDIRELISALEKRGKLIRVRKEVNKDTELMPLVRWQYRGLPEKERKAFLFEKVIDSKGRKYDIPVGVALIGASTEVYAIGLMCKVEEIREKWVKALENPIEPQIVEEGPVKEEMHVGEKLEEHGGLEEFPIPISTPGFDPAPYITAPYWVTKDPETGVRNVGTYRAMVKGRTKTGVLVAPYQHIGIHYSKCKAAGKPLEAALVIGGPPVVGMTSVAKIPYGIDEFSVASALAGEPIPLVKCETVDLEVPAYAEIVLEGEITTDYVEPEGPFGEFIGYMGRPTMSPIFKIKCISHRKNPIYQAFISQMPPSESSKIRGISFEALLYRHLKYNCNLPGVLDVAFHESCGSWYYCVIQVQRTHPAEAWQALASAISFDSSMPKYVIAVDEDVNPRDPDAVNWAVSTRAMPHRDIRIVVGRSAMLDPSVAPPTVVGEEVFFPGVEGTSAILINATRKWPYLPTALPEKKYMERAMQMWKELGLPELTPREPWYGHTLGYWPDEFKEAAELALKGEHHKTAEMYAQRGRKERVQMESREKRT
jgi:4-hydroxy-3-polyprenylbenzoate decarboxylase